MRCQTPPRLHQKEQESRIIQSLISDLKSKLALDIDEEPCTSRKHVSAPAGGGDSFLVVGSSNASRLAEALVDKGISTGSVICKSWRANKQSVADLATNVKNELDRAKYTAGAHRHLGL